MIPTLHPGQDILSFNWAYIGRKPKIGEVIVLNLNGRDMVKRVVKIEDEQIFVEGDNKQSLRLPDGSLKKASTDSRDFGAITMEKVIGKVIYRTNDIPCPKCSSPVMGIYGRKDALCKNCGFKLSCCGEP